LNLIATPNPSGISRELQTLNGREASQGSSPYDGKSQLLIRNPIDRYLINSADAA
jgi:hypothetical protein